MKKVRTVNPARIYQARLKVGTQDDLAYKIRQLSDGEVKTTAGRISRWENGTNAPHAEAVPLIAEAAGVSIDYLYGTDESSAAEDEEDSSVDLGVVLHEAAAVFARLGSAFGRVTA